MGKYHHSAYPKGTAKHAIETFEVINNDVCGPMSAKSNGESSYFVTLLMIFLDLLKCTSLYRGVKSWSNLKRLLILSRISFEKL